ncbi:hypothetical protein SLS62_008851 [Diatrype stigma]|uniref:F-box domain-containing protein n=1 Tax=Diatrype stigma TaxID=117547 RepID=A0AAN9YMH2_9PEZI
MVSLLARFRRPAPKSHAPPSSSPEMKELDIVSRLPYELREMILAELDPEGLSAALNVCRVWRSSSCWPWSSFADRWFPGLADQIFALSSEGSTEAMASAAAADGRGSSEDDNDENEKATATAMTMTAAAEMFRQALHRIQRRSSGKFASAFQHTMCLETERFFALDRSLPVAEGGVHRYEEGLLQPGAGLSWSPEMTRYPRFMMYHSGRLAWWPEMYGSPFFAVVDDLRARTRRAYQFPGHGGIKLGYKTAMSAVLFVMCRGTTVDAWHLERSILRSVEVPEDFDRCIAEGERLLFVSMDGRVFAWTFGQPGPPVDVHSLGRYSTGRVVMGGLEDFTYRFSSHHVGLRFRDSGMLIDFIIHPVLADVFFIITLGSDASKQLVVDEIHNGQRTASYPLDHPLIQASNIGDIGYLRWEKADSYGGYCLAHAWLGDLNHPANLDLSEPNTPLPGCSRECGMRGLVSFCFNIYTKCFTVLHHRIAWNTPSVHHLWNGQVITNNYDGEPGAPSESFILSVNNCSDRSGPLANGDSNSNSITSSSNSDNSSEDPPIPLYTATPTPADKDSVLQQRCRVNLASQELSGSSRNVRFAFNPHQRFGSYRNWASASDYSGVKRLVGDDHFLLFVDGGDYTAWSFGDEIPGQQITSDQGLSRWWNWHRHDGV